MTTNNANGEPFATILEILHFHHSWMSSWHGALKGNGRNPDMVLDQKDFFHLLQNIQKN
jgi:hypothetical protein